MPTEVRQFALDAPCARIWNAGNTAIELPNIVWDATANQYHPDYYNWDREDDAEPTKVLTGRVYPHILGYRLRAVLTFNIWYPGIGPRRGSVYGFTENSLKRLDDALKAGQLIEFYLHGNAAGTAQDAYRVCQHRVTNSGRGDGNWIHGMTIEFNGLLPSPTRPADL